MKWGRKSNLWAVRSRGCRWVSEFLGGSSWKPHYFATCCTVGCCFARIVHVQQWEVISAWEGSQEPDLDGNMTVLVHRWTSEQGQALSRAIRSCLPSSPVFVHRANLMFKHQLRFQLHAFWGNSWSFSQCYLFVQGGVFLFWGTPAFLPNLAQRKWTANPSYCYTHFRCRPHSLISRGSKGS